MGVIAKAWGPTRVPQMSGMLSPVAYPTELTFGADSRPVVGGRGQEEVRDGIPDAMQVPLVLLHTWESPDEQDARRYYLNLLKHGCPHDRHDVPKVQGTQVWRFRGMRAYLLRQEVPVALPASLLGSAHDTQQLRSVNVALTQLSEHYHTSFRRGVPVVDPARQVAVRASLERAEVECARVHAQALATAEALDEAWKAHGMDPPRRPFAVLCDCDVVPSAPVNGSAAPQTRDVPDQDNGHS